MKQIINKFLSGRFLFTLITAIVYLNLSLSGKLPVDKVTEVILLVIYAYFNRGDRTAPPTNGEEK